MCGICGFVGTGDRTDLDLMTEKMYHRGPDAKGIWYDSKKAIYLGHRRLSIIDISGGDQPMWTHDELLCVVFNGEIYNHLDLRKDLVERGHIFISDHSDTEVLLHGFREWGDDLPNHLNGMWAFAIYDKTTNCIFVSRDRFGKKPLFYTKQHGTFAFASELTALNNHSRVEASFSTTSLKKYFAYGYIPAPCSFYERVYKLPGGHNLLFNLNDFSIKTWKYWDFILEPFQNIPKNPEQDWGGQILDLLKKSVQRRLISDVPLGVFLSGGIDSSAIAACAAQHSEGGELRTFSIGFREASFDETMYALKVAEVLATDHHSQIFSIEEAKFILPEILAGLDEPMGDSSLLPTFLLNRETKKYVTVALSGDGGDELFAGYDPFHALRLSVIYDKLVPRPVHKAIRMAGSLLPVSHRNMSFDFKVKRTLMGLSYPKNLWNPIWLGALEPSEIEELFQEPVDIEEIYSEAIECWENCQQDNIFDKTLQFYTKLYLQNDILVKADRSSMMNSVEVRAPFLDIELVDFVRKIPHTWKYRNGQTKYILKKALEPLLPKTILYRSKKGFGVPIGEWFSKGMLSWFQDGDSSVMNKSFIDNKIQEHRQGKNDHRLFLWNSWLLSNKISFSNISRRCRTSFC